MVLEGNPRSRERERERRRINALIKAGTVLK
jgi:hypothetical protein